MTSTTKASLTNSITKCDFKRFANGEVKRTRGNSQPKIFVPSVLQKNYMLLFLNDLRVRRIAGINSMAERTISPALIELRLSIARPDARTLKPITGASTPRTPVKKVCTDI